MTERRALLVLLALAMLLSTSACTSSACTLIPTDTLTFELVCNLDALLDVDAGGPSPMPQADYCYCDYCGGLATNHNGSAGYHRERNSSSSPPCPGIGGPCRPAEIGYHPDFTVPMDLGERVLEEVDLSVAADMGVPAPRDMAISLALDFSQADLNTGCRSKITAAEACRALDKKSAETCLNDVSMNDPTLSWLVSCVMNTCPKEKFSDACVVNACAAGCCDALRACN